MAFNLESIQKTRRLRAPKIVICGPNKLGKTFMQVEWAVKLRIASLLSAAHVRCGEPCKRGGETLRA